MLPCIHDSRITDQVQPTIDLLNNLDEWHPEVLQQHSIQPADYKGSLVFRSAVESIRGNFIASSTTGREALVRGVLENLAEQDHIADYQHSKSRNRYDFTIQLERNPELFAAIEVKGGEGNSINISDRPLWAREFAVWCHLDGAIINQPAHGAHSIINRITNEMVRRHKQVDVVFFKDILCGTGTRPCPKYLGREAQMGLQTAPDVFLFPQRIPVPEDPEPPVHTLEALRLPKLILGLFDVPANEYERHVWRVNVRVTKLPNSRFQRNVQVHHQGRIVGESTSRPWQS